MSVNNVNCLAFPSINSLPVIDITFYETQDIF